VAGTERKESPLHGLLGPGKAIPGLRDESPHFSRQHVHGRAAKEAPKGHLSPRRILSPSEAGDGSGGVIWPLPFDADPIGDPRRYAKFEH
jgi:hypothetical protein